VDDKEFCLPYLKYILILPNRALSILD